MSPFMLILLARMYVYTPPVACEMYDERVAPIECSEDNVAGEMSDDELGVVFDGTRIGWEDEECGQTW